MSTKGFRRLLLGEKMPDKDDPKYKERREKELAAGRKFAKATGIDRFAAWVQAIANRHKTLFLIAVFGFVVGCFGLNIYRMAKVYEARSGNQSAIERQEQLLNGRNEQVRDTMDVVRSLQQEPNNNPKKGGER